MNENAPVRALDLDACAAEPIRVPGAIQPHGALLVVDPAGERVLQVSANLEDFSGLAVTPGQRLEEVAGLEALAAELQRASPEGVDSLRVLEVGARPLQVAVHATRQGRIVELEAPPQGAGDTLEALYPRIRRFMDELAGATTVRAMGEAATREIRALTGFNRVMFYSFDRTGDGAVLAEDGDGVLPSYLNLRFPAADIPAQARELYKRNRIRLIPTADYRPAALVPPLSPLDGQPLDLSQAALRSVSPVHLEYMRNMGTIASMSVSVLVEGELWGLISGHSAEPRVVNAQIRSACDHLGQVLSLKIEAHEQARRTSERLRLANLQTELLARLAAAESYAAGLQANPEAWAAVGGGAGAALVHEDEVISVGLVPDAAQIRDIARRLAAEDRPEAAIESLAEAWPEAAAHADVASGLLAVSISQIHPNYLMWFRPEAVRTVNWAGEPAKARELGDRLHPRKSFQLWKEQVRLRAAPWSQEEVESARRFRAAIQNFVLRQAEERAELTNRLAQINAELESFSYSISHDLRAPFRHVVGYAELLADRARGELDDTGRHYLASIRDAGLMAGRLVDDLLAFSQLGRNSLRPQSIDMNRLTADVRRDLRGPGETRRIDWRVGELPPAWGDAAMIRQVLHNLLSNAVKYSAPRADARIEVSGEEQDQATVYVVTDNGVGFDMAYVHKLFSVFQRLHRADEFEGTGIGLALVRRIVERHGGFVSAKGTPGQGASFTFSLPKRPGPTPGSEPEETDRSGRSATDPAG